jgi:ADP-ribose pyrophosphatase YjhB (NUDIX family)
MEEMNNNSQSDLGAGVLCFHENKVLLVQMNYGKFLGQWILPGGMVEKGEHPHQAALREVKEETHLDVELHKLLSVRHRLKENGLNNTYFVFTGSVKTPDPEKKIKWPSQELLSVRFWDIPTALADAAIRPQTKYYIEMARGEQERETMTPLPGPFDDYCYSME